MSTTCASSSKQQPHRSATSMVKDTAVQNGRSPSRRALAAATLGWLAFASASARAQEQAEPEAGAGAEPLEIVVIGEPPVRSAGEARIDRDVLEAAPARSGSDLLRRVPGMFVSQHSGEGKGHQLFFRGFDAVHGQDLEVSVGGVPVNEVSNVHGQGYADLHFVIPEVVHRIEARPGALRADQGDFAVAGSVLYDLGYDQAGVTVSAGLG